MRLKEFCIEPPLSDVEQAFLIEPPADFNRDGDYFINFALSRTRSNRTALATASTCGCFRCLRIFQPLYEIDQWEPALKGKPNSFDETAICPYCGNDSIVPSSPEEGLVVTTRLLELMRMKSEAHLL